MLSLALCCLKDLIHPLFVLMFLCKLEFLLKIIFFQNTDIWIPHVLRNQTISVRKKVNFVSNHQFCEFRPISTNQGKSVSLLVLPQCQILPTKTYHFMKKNISVFCQFDIARSRYQPVIKWQKTWPVLFISGYCLHQHIYL